jgi:hypothetical protein
VAQGVSKQSMHAVMDRTLKLWYLIPHMHRWGTRIKVDITKGGTKQSMFDTEWQDQFTFHSPEKRYDPASPLVLNAGDAVDIECNWNNDVGHDLVFGFEMCVSFGQFVDDAGIGNRVWDNGQWDAF